MTSELLLMFAARATHIENLIRPALERGAWVVCDRFTDATYAYQGGGRGVRREQIANARALVQARAAAGLHAAARCAGRDRQRRAQRRAMPQAGASDRFEAERREFFERVRNSYLERARSQPGGSRSSMPPPTARASSTRSRAEVEIRAVHAPMTETERHDRCRSCCRGTRMPLHSCARRGRRTACSHALLVQGAEGVGKQSFAAWLACAVLCDKSAGSTLQLLRRVRELPLFAAGSHPDLLWVAPEEDKQQISIDQVRAATERLTKTELSAGLQGRDRRRRRI